MSVSVIFFYIIKPGVDETVAAEFSVFSCPHPGCTKSYRRKYRLKEHEKTAHGDVAGVSNECTRNFSCPWDCDSRVHAFRTNKQLLSHCENVHHMHEKLGK